MRLNTVSLSVALSLSFACGGESDSMRDASLGGAGVREADAAGVAAHDAQLEADTSREADTTSAELDVMSMER